MTTGTQAKIPTRTATMRHTATLEVELNYAKERALLGVNFAGDIESLLDWRHMGAEWLCSQENSMSNVRVQMISNGIPAYQNDFANEADALAAAERLATGAGHAEKVDHASDLARYQMKKGHVRAFNLSA